MQYLFLDIVTCRLIIAKIKKDLLDATYNARTASHSGCRGGICASSASSRPRISSRRGSRPPALRSSSTARSSSSHASCARSYVVAGRSAGSRSGGHGMLRLYRIPRTAVSDRLPLRLDTPGEHRAHSTQVGGSSPCSPRRCAPAAARGSGPAPAARHLRCVARDAGAEVSGRRASSRSPWIRRGGAPAAPVEQRAGQSGH